MKEAMVAAGKTLTALAKGNLHVQNFVFNNMDSLLTLEALLGPIGGVLYEASLHCISHPETKKTLFTCSVPSIILTVCSKYTLGLRFILLSRLSMEISGTT